ISLHSLRHGYASLLIAKGLNVVFVSRQLGHANPNVTLGVYAALRPRRQPDALEARYARMTVNSRGAGFAWGSGCNSSHKSHPAPPSAPSLRLPTAPWLRLYV